MAANDDPTRGSGPEKTTEARPNGYGAAPGASGNETGGSAAPDPARGGCLKLGWGCLPVLAFLTLLPAGFLF